uniref:EGF-like domain-containing protein n=1 Tax=Ascaris lumbricoides TaxID=6252 RepID=A0A9J2PLV9_ASCLU
MSGLGDLCMTNFECSGGQRCVSGLCQCSSDEIIANGRCIPNNGLCTSDQQVYFNGRCHNTVQLGAPCVTSYQCVGGSSCFNERCVCPTGSSNNSRGYCVEINGNCASNQILVQGQCYSLSRIGQNCQINAQCVGQSLCINRRCTCPSGTTQTGQLCRSTSITPIKCPIGQVSMNGICMGRVAPGQQCQASVQCLDGSACLNSYCICPEGMNNLNGYCRKLSFTDHCNEASSIEISGQCVNVQRPGGYCQRNEQCLGGSTCINGYCSCSSETTLYNGYCVLIGKCGENQVELNGRCYRRVLIGDYCLVSDQCLGGSECTYAALCQCPYGTQEINGNCRQYTENNICADENVLVNGTCVSRIAPGANCNYTQQCLDKSSCSNGSCVCPNGMRLVDRYCVSVQSSANCNATQLEINRQCLEFASLGSKCIYNLQCLGSSTCSAGICECAYGYTNVMGYCIQIFNTPSLSQCRNTEVFINGYCYSKAYIGQYCMYNEQCQGGSMCMNNSCNCPSGGTVQGNRCSINGKLCEMNQVEIDNRCYNTSQIGQTCQLAQQCLGGSTCLNNICICPSGTQQQGDRCIGNDNTCSSNQVTINGQCYAKAEIDEFCLYNEQCEGNSLCTQNRCICPSGMVSANGRCVPSTQCQPYQVFENGQCLDTVSIGMKCTANVQCIASASCTLVSQQGSSTCQCNAGTVFTGSGCVTATTSTCPYSTVFIAGNNNCLPLVQVGQFCTYSSQCMGFSACIGQFCRCPTGLTNVNDICRQQQITSICAPNQVLIDGRCFPRIEPNAYCAHSQQCTGGSTCVNNYCTCPMGTALSNGICENTGQ